MSKQTKQLTLPISPTLSKWLKYRIGQDTLNLVGKPPTLIALMIKKLLVDDYRQRKYDKSKVYETMTVILPKDKYFPERIVQDVAEIVRKDLDQAVIDEVARRRRAAQRNQEGTNKGYKHLEVIMDLLSEAGIDDVDELALETVVKSTYRQRRAINGGRLRG